MEKLRYNIDMSEDSQWIFASPGQFVRENFLFMQETGRFISGKAYYTERAGLESYLIKYTISGSGILEYCGETYRIGPGEFFLIDCMKEQKYYTDPAVGHWDVLWVHFYGTTAGPYYETFLNTNQGRAAGRTADSSMEVTLNELLKLGAGYMTEAESDIRASSLLTELLYESISAAQKSAETSRLPDYVRRAAEYLAEHYTEPVTLSLLASKMNVSMFHFQREFTHCMGVSPGLYLRALRLKRSKELLRGTELPVTEIASEVGMDYSYFVQVFRKGEGITPLQYRKRWATRQA